MKNKFEKIWELAIPYLEMGIMKDFVVHTEGVVRAMEILIEGEGGDENILIPAAILHDVGFSKVSKGLQTNADLEKKREAQRQHLLFAADIIQEILEKVDYDQEDINHIKNIVAAHKFQDPEEFDKRMLIDTDNLSDTFPEQFLADTKSYKITPAETYEYRTRNTYYSNTAKKVAEKNMKELSDKYV